MLRQLLPQCLLLLAIGTGVSYGFQAANLRFLSAEQLNSGRDNSSLAHNSIPMTQHVAILPKVTSEGHGAVKGQTPSFRIDRAVTRVYLSNDTDRTIWVAIRHQPMGSPGEEAVKDSRSLWTTQAWFKVEPGRRIHVANTTGPRFYYYAENSAGRKWQSKYRLHRVADRWIGFRRVRLIGTEDYTITFADH